MYQTMLQRIEASPFRNVYWFARYLLNTDEYGAIGKSKEKQLLKIVVMLENMLIQNGLTDVEKLHLLKATLAAELMSIPKQTSKLYQQADSLVNILVESIKTIADVAVFCITVRYVVCPINHAIDAVPSDDARFCRDTAAHILDKLGDQKAGAVIATWDRLGTSGCLDAERAIVVAEFSKMLDNLSRLDIQHTELDDNIMMTAFVQEFERRLGQKRKARGGNSLESVASFLFEYYKFKSSPAPSHFDQDLEVDKWFQCKDGWCIGISCKRTLRERWKQLSQADRGTLSHFKIKEIWHLITYDRDLSDDKIVRLGEQGQVFYLLDDSPQYISRKDHPGMKGYVRPLSKLIEDIRNNIK